MLAASLVLPAAQEPAAAAEEITAGVQADTYTTSTRPQINSGSSPKVAVGADGRAQKVGYLDFTVPSGAAGTAELVLNVTGGSAGTLEISQASSEWTERGLTADNAPEPGPRLAEARVEGGWESVEIALDITARPGERVSLALSRGDGGITRVASRENATVAGATLRFATGSSQPPAPSSPVSSPSDQQRGTAPMPLYVSPSPDSGNSYLDAYETRRTAGWGTGFYTYWPGNLRWNNEWTDFVQRHPEGVPVLGSPKGTDASSVRGFLDQLPQAWREKWIMAYYQEPEDNFTTAAQRATFRDSVATMADLVRPYGVRNAVHLQEWTINPYNNRSWAGERALAEFFDPADVDYISWSLYPAEGKSMRAGIDRIKAFSEKYAPGIPWGITAAGSPVDGDAPIGGPERARRAEIVRDAAEYTAQVGGQSFGWFDFDEYNPGRDQLASKDPALEAALVDAAAVPVSAR